MACPGTYSLWVNHRIQVHGGKWKLESSSSLGFGMRFLVMTPKVQATKEKID